MLERAPLQVRPVEGRRDLIRFLEFPASLYRDDPAWIPPLLFERLQHLDRDRNPFFAHADVSFWVAERDGRIVGRISAQIGGAGEADAGTRDGHFGFLEAEDAAETFAALLETAEDWLRQRGARRVLGPFSLSINDECGLLIDGFETPPYVMMGHARRYYAARLEEAGYGKAKDLIAYLIDLGIEPSPAATAFLNRMQASPELSFRAMDPRRFEQEIAEVVRIFNDAWSGNWGFVPMTQADVGYLAHNIKPLLRRGDVAFGELGGEPVAMAVCLPNLNEAIADFGGRLLPGNWLKLLWRLKVRGLESARMPLMGIARKFHGTPLGTILALGVIDRVRRWHRTHGTRTAELSWILEDNRPVRRVLELFGARPYKTYRIYRKDLA